MAVIALDLGGTKLAAALFSKNGDILSKTNHALEKRMGTEVGKLIFQTANELLDKSKEINENVSAIGICVPGIAHAKTGKIWAPNIPGWDDYSLLDELKRSINDKDLKIKIDSDRDCYGTPARVNEGRTEVEASTLGNVGRVFPTRSHHPRGVWCARTAGLATVWVSLTRR